MPKTGPRKHFQHDVEDDGSFTAEFWSMTPEQRRAFNAEVDSKIDEDERDRRIDLEANGGAAVHRLEREETNGIEPERHGDGSGSGVKRSNLPSEKQIAFLKKLYDGLKPALPALELPTPKTKKEASAIIDAFLSMKKNLVVPDTTPEPKPAPERRPDPPEGFHRVDGVIYKVQKNRAGSHLYAKRLEHPSFGVNYQTGEVSGDWSFEYVGRQPFRSLSAETLLTLEQAKEFGHLYGVCGCCGARLTDEHSIDAGIGPVCAKRF